MCFQLQPQFQQPKAEELDYFGSSLDMSSAEDLILVRAYGEDSFASGTDSDQLDNSQPQSGAVYAFQKTQEGGWTQTYYIKPLLGTTDGNFGQTLALSVDGNTFLANSSYLFIREENAWVQKSVIESPYSEGYQYGASISEG